MVPPQDAAALVEGLRLAMEQAHMYYEDVRERFLVKVRRPHTVGRAQGVVSRLPHDSSPSHVGGVHMSWFGHVANLIPLVSVPRTYEDDGMRESLGGDDEWPFLSSSGGAVARRDPRYKGGVPVHQAGADRLRGRDQGGLAAAVGRLRERQQLDSATLQAVGGTLLLPTPMKVVVVAMGVWLQLLKISTMLIMRCTGLYDAHVAAHHSRR
jgi:hypothetical protein